MKRVLLFMATTMIVVLATSCNNDPVNNLKSESSKIYAWRQEVSHFMGDSIYHNGDSIYTYTEKGEDETFCVVQVLEGGIMESSSLYDMVDVRLRIESPHNRFFILVEKSAETSRVPEMQERRKKIWGFVAQNQEIDEMERTYDWPYCVQTFDVTKPTITVTSESGTTATFRRDEGLIQITDTLGHTWTKKYLPN